MSRQVVAVNRDSEIKTLADLEGKRIAVQSTTKPEALFLFIGGPQNRNGSGRYGEPSLARVSLSRRNTGN